MIKLQPQRMRFELKTILGLLLAGVAAAASAGASSAENTGSSPRTGALHVTKECSQYNFQAGSFCTITSSTIPQIKVGSRVIYAAAPNLAAGVLDTDLVIDGPGNNSAYGHVVLNLSTLTGVVTFSGGTGAFTHFHAGPIAVACPAFPECSWDGPYSFIP